MFRALVLSLLFATSVFAQTADLEVVSVTPEKTSVFTDETFAYTVRVRNNGPDAAQQVTVIAGVNWLSVLRAINAPAGWTCEGPLPRWGYSVTCTTASFGPGANAEITLTLTAPQPTATPNRVGGSIRTASTDPKSTNNARELAIALHPSATRADLVMTATGTTFTIRNDGPDDITNIMAIFTGTNVTARGEGWTCGSPSANVVCTRASLPAGTAAPLTATGAAAGRVRAEKIHDADVRNNSATATETPKLKRRAVRS